MQRHRDAPNEPPAARSNTPERTDDSAAWRQNRLRAFLVMVAVIEGALLREGHRYPHLPETNTMQTLTTDRACTGNYRGGRRGEYLRLPDASSPTTRPQHTRQPCCTKPTTRATATDARSPHGSDQPGIEASGPSIRAGPAYAGYNAPPRSHRTLQRTGQHSGRPSPHSQSGLGQTGRYHNDIPTARHSRVKTTCHQTVSWNTAR